MPESTALMLAEADERTPDRTSPPQSRPAGGEPGLAVDRETQRSAGRVAQNVAFVFSGQVLTWASAVAILAILPRYLGDARLGEFTFAWSVAGLVATLAAFGCGTYLTRAISRDPAAAGYLTSNALLSRLPGVILGAIGMVIFVNAFDYSSSTKNMVYAGTGAMALVVFGGIIAAALQGLERMAAMSVAGVVERLLVVVLGLGALILAGKGMTEWALMVVAAGAIATLSQLVYLWHVAGLSSKIDLGLWRTLYRGGAPFLVWGLSLAIYGGLDVIMLSLMTNDRVVGWYGAAYRFIGIPAFFPFAVTTALLPGLSRATRHEFTALAGRSLELVVLISLPIALFMMVGASSIIEFFRFPASFSNSVILLQILSVHVPLVAVSMLAGTVLVALNHETAWLRVGLAAAVLNPLVNLLLIPFFQRTRANGAIGASITTVMTEIFVVSCAVILVDRGTFTRSNLTTVLRCVAAGAPMAVAMVLASSFGLFAIMAAGGVTYAIAAVALGAISLNDMRSLPRMLLSRGTVIEPAS